MFVDEGHFVEALDEFDVGFFAEVAEGEEFVFGLFEDLSDEHEAAALEAVVGADGELEFVDGAVVVFGGDAEAFVGGELARGEWFAERGEDDEFVLEELGGGFDGVFGGDAAVGPDFEHELFESVGLAAASGVDFVGDAADGGEDGVEGDGADAGFAVGVVFGGLEAVAGLDVHADVEFGFGLVEGGEVEVGVDDFVVGGDLDVGGGDLALAAGVEGHFGWSVGEGAEADGAEVEEEFGGVLLHGGDGGEFVLDLFDADGGDGGAADGGEEDAADGVAESVGEAAREGFGGDAGVVGGGLFDGELGGVVLQNHWGCVSSVGRAVARRWVCAARGC